MVLRRGIAFIRKASQEILGVLLDVVQVFSKRLIKIGLAHNKVAGSLFTIRNQFPGAIRDRANTDYVSWSSAVESPEFSRLIRTHSKVASNCIICDREQIIFGCSGSVT
jgi:hypothetical protein